MKKIIVYLMMACLPMTFLANESKVNPDSLSARQEAEAKVLIQRLETLKTMDKSNLSREEKREIRKEVREIDKQLRILGGRIFISVSLLVIIALLLILIL